MSRFSLTILLSGCDHVIFTENLLIGAVNAENDKTNCVKNTMTGEWDTVPNVAK